MKILLTGSGGNLGQALQKQGATHSWVGLTREDWGKLPTLLNKVDMVIHAASDLVTPLRNAPQRVIDSNLNSTIWLLEALAKKPKVKRFIFISSCAVYGRSEVTSEEVPPSPISVNGITKLLNEEIIRDFCLSNKINYQILRLFNTFGNQDRFSIIHHLRRSLKDQKPFTLNNNGISQRDFIHVEDIAQVILALLNEPIRYPVMNIGSGDVTRIRDIVNEFKKKNPELKIVTGERPEAEYSRADITKLRQVLPDYEFRSVLDFIKSEL